MKVYIVTTQAGEYSSWSKDNQSVWSTREMAETERDRLLHVITYGANELHEHGDCIASYVPDNIDIEEWEVDKAPFIGRDEPRPGHIHRFVGGPCDSAVRLGLQPVEARR